MRPVDDLTIALAALIGVRALACLVFVELHLRHRQIKHGVLSLAWLIYALGPAFGLAAHLAGRNADHPLFGYSAAVGTLLFMIGVFLYYCALPPARIVFGVVGLIATLGLLIWRYPRASGALAVFAQMAFLVTFLALLVLRRRWFLSSGGNSYYWLFGIAVFSLVHAAGFQLVYPDSPFSARLLATLLSNVALAIFFLHFEYNQSLMQLRAREGRYRFLFNAAPVALLEGDASQLVQARESEPGANSPQSLRKVLEKLSIVSVNQQAMDLFRVRDKQALLDALNDGIEPRSRAGLLEAIAPLYEEATQASAEAAIQTADGERRDVVIDIRLSDVDTFASAVIVSMVDISERKRAEEALQAYSTQLEEMVEEGIRDLRQAQAELVRREKLAALGQLAQGLGHELRNPLGAIKNAAYLIEHLVPDMPAEGAEGLQIVNAEIARCDLILRSLLDFALGRAPRRQPVDLEDSVRRALSLVTIPDNVAVAAAFDPRLPRLQVDADQMAQVLSSIVQNAVQAMPDGGRLTIETALERPRWATVTVTDTGVGIPPEAIDYVFEPLYTTRPEAIGLGLSLAQALVHGHGGAIEVESRGVPGAGAAFTIRLPIDASLGKDANDE